MTLKQLAMLVAIFRQGSFSHAAEALGVAQPALSRQIANLEAEMGTQLIDRSSRPVSPTAAGRIAIDRAEQILDGARRLKSEIAELQNTSRPTLRVGFVGSALFGDVPQLMRTLRARIPGLHLSLKEMISIEQVSALKDGRIHVGFGRIASNDPEISQSVLSQDPLVVAAPLAHSLAGESSVTANMLKDETVILYPRQPRPSYIDEVAREFRRRDVTFRHIWEVADLHSALGLVAAGAGISIVPASVRGLRPKEVCFVDIADEDLFSPIIMNVRRGDESELLRKVLEIAGQS